MLYRQMRFFESSIVDSFYLVHKEQRFSTPAFACTMDDSNVGYPFIFMKFMKMNFYLKLGIKRNATLFSDFKVLAINQMKALSILL